jgi:hypothetical protein
MDVDVMIVDRGTFDKMFARSSGREVRSFTVRVPSMLHLIALKLHAMKNNPKRMLKDMSDIVELLRANPSVVHGDELDDVCVRYGPDGIREKLEGYL